MRFLYIYIYGGKDKTTLFLDINLKFVEKAPMYCNFSYKDYLFNVNKDKVICYQLNNKLWDYSHSDESNIEIISGYKDKVLIYLESGDLFSLDLQAGKQCWKYPEQCPYGCYGFLDSYIYHFYKDEFREISADTGKLLRTGDISDLRQKGNYFAANAGIKVYDDYVFCRDTMGSVAIIDRKTLILRDIIRFDKHLINSDNTLQWINNRLYVQDVEYTIHIFE